MNNLCRSKVSIARNVIERNIFLGSLTKFSTGKTLRLLYVNPCLIDA